MRLEGPVHIVGAGLLGTSIGLALRAHGVVVTLADVSGENLRIAEGVGAGSATGGDPQLVVVAVPPDHLGVEIAKALAEHPDAVVTDVGSVKSAPLAEARRLAPKQDLPRYVGAHPMAGSERSGPFAASATLFDGRPWAVTPHEDADPDAVALVTELARLCGAVPVGFAPEEHDRAVARTSHLPHLLASLVAGRLADAPPEQLALSGQGVRDVTRIAAGDPGLWQQIVAANTDALTVLLREVRQDVDVLLDALRAGDRGKVGTVLARGVAGTAAIPGKHGGPVAAEAVVFVSVPDHPGELARLFSDATTIGVNIEDVRIDHDPGRPVGQVELTVAAEQADHLLASLAERGWTGHR